MAERGAPRATRAIEAIALNTFREAIRDRILYLLLVFAVVVIAVARALSRLTVGSEDKIVTDLGLSAISLFGVLTAIFLGVSLVFKEVEKRTVYTLLANPVRRWHFVAGKYLGLMSVLVLNVALMTVVLLLVLRGRGGLVLLPAVGLVVVELGLVTAFALLFSSLTNPILAAVGTLSVYAIGHLSWSFELLKDRLPPGASRRLCDVLYWTLPNLALLDLKAEAVHAIAVPPARIAWAAAYGVAYAFVVLALACAIFERRDFT